MTFICPSSTVSDSGRRKALSVAVDYHELHAKHPEEKPSLKLNGTHEDPPRLKRLLEGEFHPSDSLVEDIVITSAG